MDTQPGQPGGHALDGPHRIGARGQISFPAWLLQLVDLVPGEEDSRVFVATNPDLPGTLLVIPARMVNRELPALVEAIRGQQPPPGEH